MKKLKPIFAMLIVGGLLFAQVETAAATDIPSEAVYDLTKGGIQEFAIQDENGEEATVIVEELPENARVDAGTYKITHKAAGWTAGFYVQISSNKFTSAYSTFCELSWGNISNAKLIRNSDAKVTYSFVYKAVLSHDTGVISKITDGKLVISKR